MNKETAERLLGDRGSGKQDVDYWTRVFAIDLFADPAGAKSLATYWTTTFGDRPRGPTMEGSMSTLIEQFLVPKFDLALWFDERPDGSPGFVLRLFVTDYQLALPDSYFEAAGRWRAYYALSELVKRGRRAFLSSGRTGVRKEMRLGNFLGNEILKHYFERYWFTVLSLAYFESAVAQLRLGEVSPVVAADLHARLARGMSAGYPATAPMPRWWAELIQRIRSHGTRGEEEARALEEHLTDLLQHMSAKAREATKLILTLPCPAKDS